MTNIIRPQAEIKFSTDLAGEYFNFISTWGLFSPREIDDGTKLLLKYLKVKATDNCLDLGCGYGAIGLWMAKKSYLGTTHLIDKDFIATEYSQKNAQLNKITNTKTYLSNGFSQVPAIKFNCIASNMPAKIGKELMTIMLLDIKSHLANNGEFMVVTINGLRDYMKKNLQQIFGNYKKIKQGTKYTVAAAKL